MAGAGTRGATIGLRTAEQSRQTALSIANAKDRAEGAKANYVLGGKSLQNSTQDFVNRQKLNPLAAFTNVATSGLNSYGQFN